MKFRNQNLNWENMNSKLILRKKIIWKYNLVLEKIKAQIEKSKKIYRKYKLILR